MYFRLMLLDLLLIALALLWVFVTFDERLCSPNNIQAPNEPAS